MHDAIIALIGAAIGGLIAYYSAIFTNRRLQFNIAAGKFRAAFVETKRLLSKNRLYDLSAKYDNPIFNILDTHIINHERAKIRFSAFVSKNDLEAFDKAWDGYYSKSKDGAGYCLVEYSCEMCHKTNKPLHDSLEQKRCLALNRIGQLLHFTKFK